VGKRPLVGPPLPWLPRQHHLVTTLRVDAHLAAKVVGKASTADAQHIAAASVAAVDLVVSWNFKHIVHYEKIKGYQGVNLLNGYQPISIHSPKEVVNL